MAQNADQSIRAKKRKGSLYEIHLREKACDALYLDAKRSDVNFLFFEKKNNRRSARKLIEKVPAHKIILAAASPVFDAEFFGSIKENGDVEIVDSSPEAFKEFLQCFYLGTVTFTMKNIPEIMNLANKYDVPDCMNACTKFVNDNLTSKDICWVYDLAILHEHQELKKFCDEFITTNADTVLKSNEFLTCSKKMLREILKLDLLCKESIVFDRCLAWAKNACQQNGMDENVASNLRDQLDFCLFLFRFGSMTIQEFSLATLGCEGIFTVGEMDDIVSSISLKGFVSKKFNQNPRLCWDQSKVWMCETTKSGKTSPIQSREIVFITSNRTALLGGIFFWSIQHMGSYGYILNAKVSIVEIQGQSFATGTGKILYEETSNIPFRVRNYLKLSTPIIIKPTNTYKFCLEVTNQTGNQISFCYRLGEVKSSNGLIITFHNVGGRGHMISGLDLIE
ncbi:BTB/POZ domain-containing protein 1-like [Contarinia nasturtii]|uniref:BTB/POZ domain-containing protein 1-like n=1 Tax=Contarinia nasturtii TaxID=265458 RepID=UPI0012D4AB4A|nr:BTB/POZ domain-containing protein 1-like [Contarinia nasturtii]